MEERRIFTEHVRALARGGEGPNLDEVWEALRIALRSEMRKRGLWEISPACLGLQGAKSWSAGGGGAKGKVTPPLDELLNECYHFVFVQRLDGLQGQLLVKDNIDGLVFLNIRHFLTERQSAHDPIGARIFAVLHDAARRAVEEGGLRIVGGDSRIRNDTVFELGGPVAEGAARGLGEIVTRWNDELLPDLVTLQGRDRERVVVRLRDLLSGLSREGIETLRFQDLLEPLRADVRSRWGAYLEADQGERIEDEGEVVKVVRPGNDLEERQLYRKLVECILRGIPLAARNEKTKGYLSTLFQFLRVQIDEGIEPDRSVRLRNSVGTAPEATDDEPPSRRRLAEILRIPRERMGELFETLGELLQDCRKSVGGRFRAENSSR